jgi:hypothetical protein
MKSIRWLSRSLTLVGIGICAAPLPGQGTWEATLLGHDINGYAVAGRFTQETRA